MSSETKVRSDVTEPRQLPDLSLLLDQIHTHLLEQTELGVLSITVIRRGEHLGDEHWEDYENLLGEISVFLDRFNAQRLRSSDILLEPILAGNTFVVLLGPPREDRALHAADLAAVRHRLMVGVYAHIRQALSRRTNERFGVYVGASLMRHDSTVAPDRIIYRALEQSLADALGQQKRESRRNAFHLMRLIESESVHTVYQPVVDMVDRRVIGFEALTRPPQKQFSSPELLFKAAHREGVLWPLERICRQRALENIPALKDDQLLFLNTEPESIFDPALRQDTFLRQLENVGLDPAHVVLEVTEHAAVEDFVTLRRALHEIRDMGFRLAMDDVGSGYAGLQAIAEMRPDFLKIDMTLVRGVHQDAFKRELIATIRRFADSTGIILVAEGVEQIAELESLAEVGVRCAQGYLFARPGSPPGQPDWDWLLRT